MAKVKKKIKVKIKQETHFCLWFNNKLFCFKVSLEEQGDFILRKYVWILEIVFHLANQFFHYHSVYKKIGPY